MKKLTGILIAAALLLAPISASALEMMTDASMKDVTGQAGVSIAIDDVVLESWVGDTRYTDEDGTAGMGVGTDAGSVVISDQHTIQDFQAILTDGTTLLSPGTPLAETGLLVGYTGTRNLFDMNTTDGFEPSALSIDVGTCPVLTTAHAAGGGGPIAGVVIGLPTLEINTSASTMDIGIASDVADNNGFNYITIEEGASTLHILGGHVEIAPH